MTKHKVLVTWVSFNHDPFERDRSGRYVERDGERLPGATLELLFNDSSPLRGQVQRVYVLVRRAKRLEHDERRVVHKREEEVFEELRRVLEDRASTIKVTPLFWDTEAPPTDHREIFRFTAHALPGIRAENPRATLAFNLSPGTPQMQTVMLLALQARLAGDDVRAFQGTPRDKRSCPEDVVREVPWNLLSELASLDVAAAEDGAPTDNWTYARARSPRMRGIAELIARYGGVPFPVLILGPRGIGKTQIARELRQRYREQMVRQVGEWDHHLNCAEFEGDMLRSELFGHEKGAFTGAEARKIGLLEKVKDDCVFLDEIHRLDPQAQGMLLLALQRGGFFRRVGGTEQIKARFRLIAATNQDRAQLRESLALDFQDRISDLRIELPDLRECREDLGDIWTSVVVRACEELSERVPDAAKGAARAYAAEFVPHRDRIERALHELRLPGNFRDLERLARRLLVAGMSRSRQLSIREEYVREELARIRTEEQLDAAPRGSAGMGLADELPTLARCEDYLREQDSAGRVVDGPEMIETWEKRLLIAARNAGGSGRKGAALVRMNGRTFNARLEHFGESRERGAKR
jgi:transcriptional regulator with AAA-type ATPase domain